MDALRVEEHVGVFRAEVRFVARERPDRFLVRLAEVQLGDAGRFVEDLGGDVVGAGEVEPSRKRRAGPERVRRERMQRRPLAREGAEVRRIAEAERAKLGEKRGGRPHLADRPA